MTKSTGPDVEDRFWAKVDKNGPVPEHHPELGPCWLWTAARMANGYGSFKQGAQSGCAHRTAYELAVGPIPNGLHIDHLCRVSACVNPTHLEAVTPRENTRRGLCGELLTHCKRAGHPYTPDNTGRNSVGRRICLACEHERRLDQWIARRLKWAAEDKEVAS